jgi:hypothetical protein
VPNNVVREVFMTVALNQRDDPHGWIKNFCWLFKTIHSFIIHSLYKHNIGYRLSRTGLEVAYIQQAEV